MAGWCLQPKPCTVHLSQTAGTHGAAQGSPKLPSPSPAPPACCLPAFADAISEHGGSPDPPPAQPRVARPWPRLPREAEAAPSLAGFQARLDGALSTLGWWKMSLLMAG